MRGFVREIVQMQENVGMELVNAIRGIRVSHVRIRDARMNVMEEEFAEKMGFAIVYLGSKGQNVRLKRNAKAMIMKHQ